MFEFNPESANTSWEPAQYEATITHTEEGATQKNGDLMLIVTYKLHHPNGRTQQLKDYFVKPPADGSRPGNLFRLRALCIALGDDVYTSFKAGKLNHEKQLRGRNLLLGIKREFSEQYGDQNRIDTYTKLERPTTKAAVGAGDEEVPF